MIRSLMKLCKLTKMINHLSEKRLYVVFETENRARLSREDFDGSRNLNCEEYSSRKVSRSRKRWGGALRILPKKRVHNTHGKKQTKTCGFAKQKVPNNFFPLNFKKHILHHSVPFLALRDFKL